MKSRTLLGRLRPLPWLVACTVIALSGCDDDEDISQDDTTPIVGVMELALSLRNAAPAPAEAMSIETSPTELRLDGHKVIDLENGAVPAAERDGSVLPKLRTAIHGGAARRAARLRLHVNTAYETVLLVLGTLKATNINTVGFEVRSPATPAESGWLVIDHFAVEPHAAEAVELEATVQRGWGDFAATWQETYGACRQAHYVDCAYKPEVVAEGGKVEIALFTRGSALKAEFTRFGAPDPLPTGAPQMIEGVPSGVPDVEAELPPATYAAFTWRFEGATGTESPISLAFRPLCGSQACGVVTRSDAGTPIMRLLSFLGAAFPDGTQAPFVRFELPAS